jgi:predicted nucleic acid-binding protein
MTKSTRSSTRPETFVDTSGFYALLVRGEPRHARAKEVLARAARSGRRFVTTDYVLDETATLLKARGCGHLARPLFETVFQSAACQVKWMDAERFGEVQRFFFKHQDQDWSFTDCFSFCVMRPLGIRDALTTDHHFRQAGFHALLG